MEDVSLVRLSLSAGLLGIALANVGAVQFYGVSLTVPQQLLAAGAGALVVAVGFKLARWA